MKFTPTSLLLASAALVSARPNPQHSHAGGAEGGMSAATPPTNPAVKMDPKKATQLEELAPLIKAARVLDAKPEIRQGSQRKLVQLGPWTMPASKGGAGSHAHSENPTGGGIMSGGAGIGALDPWSLLQGKHTLALAKYLASSMDPDGFNLMYTLKGDLCKDCTVLGVKMDVVFENGTRADISSGVYLHHIITINSTPRKMKLNMMDSFVSFCSGSTFMNDIMGTAFKGISSLISAPDTAVFGFGAVDEFKQMFTTPDGKFDSGFYLTANDTLFFQGEVVNYRKEPQKIYLQFDVEYVPGKVGKEAATTFTTTTSCDKPLGFIGEGDVGKNSGKPMTVTQDGTIVAARGHMHDGGDSMTVWLNDKQICVSKATYGGTFVAEPSQNAKNWTTISRMSECSESFPVKKGDKIRIDAAWDKVSHPLRESGGMKQEQMGLVAFTFVAAT